MFNKLLTALFIIVIGVLTAGFISYAWTEPTTPPPSGNIAISGGGDTLWTASNNIIYAANTGSFIGVGAPTADTTYKITTSGGGIKAKGSTIDSSRYALYAENSGGAALMAVRNDGNIGIGTATPSYKLDVSGSANFSGVCLNGSCISSWPTCGSGYVLQGITSSGPNCVAVSGLGGGGGTSNDFTVSVNINSPKRLYGGNDISCGANGSFGSSQGSTSCNDTITKPNVAVLNVDEPGTGTFAWSGTGVGHCSGKSCTFSDTATNIQVTFTPTSSGGSGSCNLSDIGYIGTKSNGYVCTKTGPGYLTKHTCSNGTWSSIRCSSTNPCPNSIPTCPN